MEDTKIWGSRSPNFARLLKDFELSLAKQGNYLHRYWGPKDGFRVDDYTNWPHLRRISTAEHDAGKRVEVMPQRPGLWTAHPAQTDGISSFPPKYEHAGNNISNAHRIARDAFHWRVPYMWKDEDGKKRVHFRHPDEIDDRMTVLDLNKWYYINFLDDKKMPATYSAVDKGEVEPVWLWSDGFSSKGGQRPSNDEISKKEKLYLQQPGHEHHYLIRFREGHFDEVYNLPIGDAPHFVSSNPFPDPDHGLSKIFHKKMPPTADYPIEHDAMPLWFWSGNLDYIELPRRAGEKITADTVEVKHNTHFDFGGDHLLFGLITSSPEGILNYPFFSGEIFQTEEWL